MKGCAAVAAMVATSFAPAVHALMAAPQPRTTWVDSTYITGVAQKVLPEIPSAPPPAQFPEPDPGPKVPVTVAELLSVMSGAQLYVQPYAPYNLPSFVRVVVSPSGASVQSPYDFSQGGATSWIELCQLSALQTQCEASSTYWQVNAGTFTISETGITWRFPGNVFGECSFYGHYAGNGGGDYAYYDWWAGHGEFSNFAGSGLSGNFFQNAYFNSTASC